MIVLTCKMSVCLGWKHPLVYCDLTLSCQIGSAEAAAGHHRRRVWRGVWFSAGAHWETKGWALKTHRIHTHTQIKYHTHTLCNVLICPTEMSLDSAGFKSRSRPPLPPPSTSSAASGAPGGAAGGSQSGGVFPRRGLPSVGRDSHDRCLEELEKERYCWK